MSNVTHRARIRQAGQGEARVYGGPSPSAAGMHRCLSFAAAVRGREGSTAPSHHAQRPGLLREKPEQKPPGSVPVSARPSETHTRNML